MLADLADSAAAQVFHAWLKSPLHPGFSNTLLFPLYHLPASAGTVLDFESNGQGLRESEARKATTHIYFDLL